jgi:NOL1/NOP2/sun family putative RNA methylase
MFLEQQSFGFESFPGFNDIFRITYQPYPIGKSLSHFLGHIYVQDIASMLPPKILNPMPGELVLDMSAAPGSKTTQMAVMMNNEGLILANDIVQKRLRSLINNLQRIGIVNTAVVKNYGESLGNQYFEVFDKILLDPACSGLGTLHKSPEVLSWWTPNHCLRLAASQKSLIGSAIKAMIPGGIIVYSTCTLTPAENEEIIQYAIDNYPVSLEKVDLPELTTRPGLNSFQAKSFHSKMDYCRRIYPFENQTEGFFVAKLRKIDNMERPYSRKVYKSISRNVMAHDKSPVKKYLDHFSSHFGISRKDFSTLSYEINREISGVTKTLANFQFKSKPLKAGLKIGRTMAHIGKLTTEGTHFFGPGAEKNVIDLENLEQLEKFVNRMSIYGPASVKQQVIVKYRNIPIGYGLVTDGKIKSQFPKAEWEFNIKG